MRIPWLDHLRTFIVVIVVHLHACITYSHVGDWYVKAPEEPTLTQKIPFILWLSHLQAFSMGLLFFISGYFADPSLNRRGVFGFVRERIRRLGLPALFYMLVIHPFILHVLNPWDVQWPPLTSFYRDYILSGRFLRGSGPLWFAVALLLFSLALAARRLARRERLPDKPAQLAEPSARQLLLFAIGLGLVTFVARLAQPIGTDVFNLQLGYFPQYIAFFVAGTFAARHGWLTSLAKSRHARRGGLIAVVAGPAILIGVMHFGARSGAIEDFFGGWHWQAFGYAMWEQLAGVGLSLGLLALFSRHLDEEQPWLRWLCDHAFGVFVFHAPILIALYMLFRDLTGSIYLLTALLTASGLISSYLVAYSARRIPGLKLFV